MAILDGFHAVKHALRFGASVTLITTDDPDATGVLVRDLAPDLRDEVMARLSVLDRDTLTRAVGHRHPTGVVGLALRPTPDNHGAYRCDPRRRADRTSPALLVADPHHGGNLGAVIRVAAAGGASGVIVLQAPDRSIDPFSRGVIRGAAGLHWALPVVTTASVRELEGPLVALDAQCPPEGLPMGTPLDQPMGPATGPWAVPADSVLCLGSERDGLPEELLDMAECLAIPMRAGVSSLNVATAAAVALYAAGGPGLARPPADPGSPTGPGPEGRGSSPGSPAR